jgi:hypothetical protein
MKSEPLDVSASTIEDELVEVEGGAEEVEAIAFELEEDFRDSRMAFTLLAYSQVRGR